ncbi:MAG: hypothetical protein ACYCO9_10015 [Streptosporangiaceae bacterium]
MVVLDGPARFAARVWFAVCSARVRSGEKTGHLAAGPYLLRRTVRGMHPAAGVKALVDGASAAMQRVEPGRLGAAIARLSRLLDVDAGYRLPPHRRRPERGPLLEMELVPPVQPDVAAALVRLPCRWLRP